MDWHASFINSRGAPGNVPSALAGAVTSKQTAPSLRFMAVSVSWDSVTTTYPNWKFKVPWDPLVFAKLNIHFTFNVTIVDMVCIQSEYK